MIEALSGYLSTWSAIQAIASKIGYTPEILQSCNPDISATEMEHRGITTEKGNTNRAIKARNNMVPENSIQQRADNERRIKAPIN